MGLDIVGKQIASLRRERGIKQEELANFVGVSVQAVSKWENGGVPDTELLPRIADFFEVSVDSLFGRGVDGRGDLRTAIHKKISETPGPERFKLAFKLCWTIERALCGEKINDGEGVEIPESLGFIGDWQIASSLVNNCGFTRMGLNANRIQYFLLVPETPGLQAEFFEGIDYLSFFKDFSDKDVFDACVMLCRRENEPFFSYFTCDLLVKKLGIEAARALEIIEIFKKYNLLSCAEIRMEDAVKTVYSVEPNMPSFVALLIFAGELISAPGKFIHNIAARSKPYLQ